MVNASSALPRPPGVKAMQQRGCAHEEDAAVMAAATAELAPQVNFPLLRALRLQHELATACSLM